MEAWAAGETACVRYVSGQVPARDLPQLSYVQTNPATAPASMCVCVCAVYRKRNSQHPPRGCAGGNFLPGGQLLGRRVASVCTISCITKRRVRGRADALAHPSYCGPNACSEPAGIPDNKSLADLIRSAEIATPEMIWGGGCFSPSLIFAFVFIPCAAHLPFPSSFFSMPSRFPAFLPSNGGADVPKWKVRQSH